MTTTIIKPDLEANVEGLGEVYRADIPFDQALESLIESGIKNPISSRDLVYSRIKKGKESSLNRNGSYTKEGFLHLKNEPVLLALISPLLNLELAGQAVEENRKGNYFSTNKEIYQEYREKAENEKSKEPEQRSVLILPKRENYAISTNTFNENELSKFLFKDQAENYGKFLEENKINEMSVWLVDKKYADNQEETVLTQLWLCGLDNRSDLYGNNRCLYYDYRVRGVFEKAGEAGRILKRPTLKQKIKLPYNKNQINKVSDIVSGVREGRIGVSKLEKVVEFLEKLKE